MLLEILLWPNHNPIYNTHRPNCKFIIKLAAWPVLFPLFLPFFSHCPLCKLQNIRSVLHSFSSLAKHLEELWCLSANATAYLGNGISSSRRTLTSTGSKNILEVKKIITSNDQLDKTTEC